MDVGNAAYDRNVQHQQMHQQSQQPASQQPDQGNARQPDGTERPPAGGVGANGQPAPHQTATADKSHVGQRDTRGGSFLTRKLPLQDATTLFILINTLDIFMTYVLMRFGAIEANPFANYFFKKYNFNGMIFFKLAIVAGVCVIAQVVATKSIRKGKNLLMLGSILVGAVVIYSVMLFVTKFL